MDFLKKTVDRARQGIAENFGDASKTEFDPEFQALLNRADDVKLHTEKLLCDIEVLAQPDPAARLLPGFTQEGMNNFETLGEHMSQFAKAVALWVPPAPELSAGLKSGDDAFVKVGKAYKDYLEKINNEVLTPMKRFLNEDMKAVEAERRMLNTRRLDMDSAKNKLEKTPDSQAFEDELAKAKAAFDEQKEKVKGQIEQLSSQQAAVQQHIKKFIQLHLEFSRLQTAALDEYQKRL